MNKTFKNKIMGFAGVFLMTMMLVVAAGVYPNPFVSDNEADVAIVYGASAAATDVTAAESIVNSLANGIVTAEDIDRILSDGVTEDEIVLGSIISANGKIRVTLTDNQIPSLFDGKIDWYDGTDTDSYNVHEEIIIGNLVLETTLDNNELEGTALTNNKALTYKYVFEEDIFTNTIDLGTLDADPLEITILGKEYLIESVTGNSITVTDADEGIFKIGDTFTANGKTFTIDDIYDDAISVNGVFIKENKKRTINEVQIKVEDVYYKDSLTLPSKVKLYYGGEISKEYIDGDAYIEAGVDVDEDKPEWVWAISNPGQAGGHIGVEYNLKQVDEEDDVVYEGGEYIFPNGFAVVSFDGLTDVSYSDYEVFFDEVELYIKDTSESKGYKSDTNDDDVEVVVIEGTEDDSFELSDGTETDTIYLYKVGNIVKAYYKDVVDDFDGKAIFYKDIELSEAQTLQDLADLAQDLADETDVIVAQSLADVAQANDDAAVIAQSLANEYPTNTTLQDLADLAQDLADETDVIVAQDLADVAQANDDAAVIAQSLADSYDLSIVTLIVDETEKEVSVSIDGMSLLIGDINGYIYISLGEKDNNEDGNIYVSTGVENLDNDNFWKDIRTEDNDVMDYYGTIIESPESNMDDDRVVLKVPSEQVYAQISVSGSKEDSSVVANETTPAELGIAKVTDGQVPADKNIIVVGGSCINTMAADLLGGKFCGAEFTAKTGVVAGKFLIQTFDRGDGNIATLVAGYNAEDTSKGVMELLKGNINIAVGEKVIM